MRLHGPERLRAVCASAPEANEVEGLPVLLFAEGAHEQVLLLAQEVRLPIGPHDPAADETHAPEQRQAAVHAEQVASRDLEARPQLLALRVPDPVREQRARGLTCRDDEAASPCVDVDLVDLDALEDVEGAEPSPRFEQPVERERLTLRDTELATHNLLARLVEARDDDAIDLRAGTRIDLIDDDELAGPLFDESWSHLDRAVPGVAMGGQERFTIAR